MKKFLKYFLFYILSLCLGLFLVTTFSWKGNPPLKWNEIGEIFPIMAITGVIICVIFYFQNENNSKEK